MTDRTTWMAEARRMAIEECAKVAEDTTRAIARGDFALVGPVGIGMKIAQEIRALDKAPK